MAVKYIVQRYARFPIYEPAEGGYYYDGIRPDGDCSTHENKAEAIDALFKLVAESNDSLCNADDGKVQMLEGYLVLDDTGTTAYSVNHKYIGDGLEYFVEPINRRGRHRRGYVPYC